MTRTAAAALATIVIAAGFVTARPLIAGAASGDPGAGPLLQQVPAALRTTCGPASAPQGADAAVVCKPRRVAPSRVVFLGFSDPASALSRYLRDGDSHGIPRDTAGDCFSYIDSESPFRTKDGAVGRVFCAHRDHSIEWTYGTVVARATGNANTNDLYTWWARLVGRTLNATQQALFGQVPTGIDRTNCQDNGDASIKCTSPAENVYVAKYTRYPTPDAMTAAYSSALASAKLTLNLPPLRGAKNPCHFETTWGPTGSQSSLGRVACFQSPDATYHFLWTITGQATLVEAYGPSRSEMTQFFKAFAIANKTSSPQLTPAG